MGGVKKAHRFRLGMVAPKEIRRLQLFSRIVRRDLRTRDPVKPEVAGVAGAVFGLIGGSNRIGGKVFSHSEVAGGKEGGTGCLSGEACSRRRRPAGRRAATSGNIRNGGEEDLWLLV
ncbi:hypothetical protein U1Q18_019533 [Sarracenia purpurea var. burkii]